jgi:hypothetical protein
MGGTCLIFTIQLSPADLELVRDVLADIQTAHRQTIEKSSNSLNIDFFRFEGIIQDLTEIILQSRTNQFKFNAYILKMAIVKLQFILSEIQLATDQRTMDMYYVLSQCYIKLLNLFTNVLESI